MTASYLMTIGRFGAMALGAIAAPAALSAQVNRAPEKDASHIMVTALKSTEKGEKGVGAQAIEALTNKINSNMPAKQIYVVPKTVVDANLTASGFSVTEALAGHDAKALASMLRADEYLAGTATRSPTGVKLDVYLVLTRDPNLRQPLGVAEAPKLDNAADAVVKEMKEAWKQLDGEKKCTNAARAKQYAEAIAAAKAGITAYPKATLARICLASVLDVSGAKPEEVLAVTHEILTIDPASNPGLRLAVKEYQALKNDDSTAVNLVKLLATDPTNATLSAQVVATLLQMKNLSFARAIVDTAVANNPGDPDLLKMRWSILYSSKDYKEMYAQGEELAKIDTSFTDSTYFARTATAYANDSMPQKAAETLAKGLQKFPNNAFFTAFEVQQLQKAGQQQQALDLLDKALAAKVPVENAGLIHVGLLRDLKRTAEILPAVRAVIAAGDTSAVMRQLIFAQAAEDKKTALAAATSQADSLTAYRASLATVAYADSSIVGKSALKAEAQFRLGAEHLQLVQPLLKVATATKSCPLAKEAKDHITEAQILLPQGGAYDPKLVAQLMGALTQLDPFADQTIKGLACK